MLFRGKGEPLNEICVAAYPPKPVGQQKRSEPYSCSEPKPKAVNPFQPVNIPKAKRGPYRQSNNPVTEESDVHRYFSIFIAPQCTNKGCLSGIKKQEKNILNVQLKDLSDNFQACLLDDCCYVCYEDVSDIIQQFVNYFF